MSSKKQIRDAVLAQLKEIPNDTFHLLCNQIAEHLYTTEAWRQAKTIAITMAFTNEIHTRPIIERAWAEGKKVAIPKCKAATHTMDFRYFTHWEQVESVYKGILEPIEEVTSIAKSEELDFMIVPGVAFSESGYRIGYGGGYYDRYLQTYKGMTASLLLPFQLCSQLPIDAHDIPVKCLIFPNGVQMIDGN
ncbi:MAG: 5-formyltetrahydrofolate cyclo-ligase [Bacillus sp. (in: firmicutes)]